MRCPPCMGAQGCFAVVNRMDASMSVLQCLRWVYKQLLSCDTRRVDIGSNSPTTLSCMAEMPSNLKPAPQPEYVLRGHAWEVQTIAFHPDGHLLYTGYVHDDDQTAASLSPTITPGMPKGTV